jgi:RHS repeat-associated protein
MPRPSLPADLFQATPSSGSPNTYGNTALREPITQAERRTHQNDLLQTGQSVAENTIGSELAHTVLNDKPPDAIPRPHGQIRKLRLAPPASAVGASTTYTATTDSALDNRAVDIPSIQSDAAQVAPPPPAKPFIPTVAATSDSMLPITQFDPSSSGDAATGSNSIASSSDVAPTGPTNDDDVFKAFESGSSTAASSSSEASETSSTASFAPVICSGSTGGTQSGSSQSGGSSSGNSGGTSPGSCSPSAQAASASSDNIWVLNWHDGLVMVPDVIEFDQVTDYVELRAQVAGATVQSWSWDTSGASRIGCVNGSSTYKLRFRWTGYSPTETTEQITITATMTDSSTQVETLTFKLAAGSGTSCPSGGGYPTTTWPAVLTPDKPLETQETVFSDSASRPYAVSEASGTLSVGHALPAYNPGVPALGLTYSSIAAERRPIFVGRYELDPSGAVPNTVSARLQFNGSWGSTKYYDTSPSTTKHNPGNILTISLQADASSLATDRYAYSFETTANYSGSSTTTTSSGSVTIINEESSVFGEGWMLDVLDRLHVVTGGVILNQGAGNSLWFASNGGGYTTPAGDFSTLTYSSNVYTRTLKDGTLQKFNSSGYQTSLVDRNSNIVTFSYDGSNNLSTITDPNNLVTTFGYTSGKVSTITDPAGRITTLSYSSGRLESIKDPDGSIATFSYDSSSGRMTTYKDPLSNVSTFAYDFAGRVDTVTRPDTTTEQFTPLQLQSLCDTSQCTSGSPGTPLLAAEAVADYTDPRSNAWDTRLDWYGLGSATQLTDPLGQSVPAGHMTVLHRSSNACVTQSTDRLDRNLSYTLDSKCNVTTLKFPGVTSQSTTTYSTQQFEYNSFSQVTKKTDELGRVTSFTYDAYGNLTQITLPDPDGGGSQTSPITTMTYDGQGRMETLKDARSNTTTFSYDSYDRVTQITYPDDDGNSSNNPKVTITYDSASNVETRIDERGYTTSFSYDPMNGLKTVTTPDRDGAGGLPAPVTTFTYDAAGNNTVITRADPDGGGSLTSPITTMTYNSMNRRATEIDALSNTTTFGYDNDGNLVTVTDPLSRTTTFTYNELGQNTVITQPDPDGGGSQTSPITTMTYDAEGQKLTIKDPLSRVTTFTWNNRGWMATQTDAAGSVTTFSYDVAGNPAQNCNSGGCTGWVYDNLDRATEFTDQLSNKTTFTYDQNGNRTTVKDALSHVTSYSYDARNRLTVVTQPDPDDGGSLTSPVTTFGYDLAGNRVTVTDPLSRVTTTAFDPANRVTSITQPDPDGGGSLLSPITTFTYDNLDRTLSLKDPVNNLTTWSYDAIDQVLTETDPLSKVVTYTHDAAGQLTRIVDRKNQRRDFAYDNLGRRTQEYWCPPGSSGASGCGTSTPDRIFTYTYDAANQLTEVNETDSRYTFTFDNMGRVTGISSLGSNMPQVRLTNTYDPIGRRTAVEDNLSSAGKISFTYDAGNRVTNVKMTVGGTLGPQVTMAYDAANRLTSLSRQDGNAFFPPPNKVLTTFTYDNDDRVLTITHTYVPGSGSSSTLATYLYTYNAASELTTEVNQDGTYTYSYDNTSQLIGVDASGGSCGASGCDESFSYDVNGNRTMSGYTTGTGNRLTADGTYTYTYDDNGNTLTKTRISDSQKWEYTWDYRNRLTQVVVKNAGGTILQQSDFTFDAFDRRIIKSFDDDGPGPHSATVTKTIYDGADFAANPYADFDGSNALTMRYLYGPAVDMTLARRNASGTVAWHLTDHLGSVHDVVTTNGATIDHVTYSAFGGIIAETSSSNGDRFKFTGHKFDSDSGQYQARARSYDPQSGRFVSADPIGFASGDTNQYRYAANRSTTNVDRLGLDNEAPSPTDAQYWPADPSFADYPGAEGFDYAAYTRDFAEWSTARSRYARRLATIGSISPAPPPDTLTRLRKAKDYALALVMSPWGAEAQMERWNQQEYARQTGYWVQQQADWQNSCVNTLIIGVLCWAAPYTGAEPALGLSSIAHNAAEFERYRAAMRAAMSRPHVADPRLAAHIGEVYRAGAKIGSGSTAAAVRHEIATGQAVGGRLHSQKAQDYIRTLQKWLEQNQAASAADRAAAENVIRDLQNALGH